MNAGDLGIHKSKFLIEATKQSLDQIDLSTESTLEAGVNKMQITTPAADDPGILAGKSFGVTSGIL